MIPYDDAISSTTVFNNYVAEQKELDQSFTYSILGSGTENDPYQISNFYDFIYVFNKRGIPSNKYYVMTGDVVFNDGKFVENEETGKPEYHQGQNGELRIFSYINTLKTGIHFDGQGHSIKGFYGVGLFYIYWYTSLQNSTFKNVNFVNSYCANESVHALLANQVENCIFENCSTDGWADGEFGSNIFVYKATNTTFRNCTNYGKNITPSVGSYGNAGICGFATNCLIENCVNRGDNLTGHYSGAIVGRADGTTKVIGCKNYAEVKVGTYTGGICYTAGGAVEFINCENRGVCSVGISCGGIIQNCKNYGDCTDSGIGGYRGTPKLIENCENYGECTQGIGQAKTIRNCKNFKLAQTGWLVTGIGASEDNLTIDLIENCINYASVEGDVNFEGIGLAKKISNCINYGNANVTSNVCGVMNGEHYVSGKPTVEIINCSNHGNLISSNGACGGICSYTQLYKINFTNCTNYGYVKGKTDSGGICGRLYTADATMLMTNCINYGDVFGNSYVGGLVGQTGRGGQKICIQKSSNCGVVNGNTSGGIIGKMLQGRVEMSNCKNEGKVVGKNSVGGIVASIASSATLSAVNFMQTGELVHNNANTFSPSSSSISNSIAIYKKGDETIKEYCGSDFSAFFVKWKTGYIGLKVLESAGVYMFAIPDEQSLQRMGFEKIA